MTENIIRAWALAADEDFGGSLDGEKITVGRKRTPASGVPYVYCYARGFQVKIPGVKTKCFPTIDLARDYVALHVVLE